MGAAGFQPQAAMHGLKKGNLVDAARGRNESELISQNARGVNGMNQTLDVEENKAESIADNISAGGTRYIVGFKGGLKFYGQQSQMSQADSVSNYSKSKIERDDS